MRVNPDEGMQLITQRMAADRITDGAGPETSPAGLELDADINFVLALRSAVEANTRALRGPRPRIPWEACHPVPLNPINLSAGATGSDERWEPREGVAWHVVRVGVVSQTATAAAVFRDTPAAGAWQVQAFTMAAGAFAAPWEPRGLILLPGQRLVWTATGGTATVNGDAIEVDLDWLATYLI